ncbi:hypothetical protein BsWGS_07314 [Bradybaena similaris]
MDAGRTAAVFEKLQLGVFSEDWVKACWESEFVDLNTVPQEGEALLSDNNHFTQELKFVEEVLSTWLESDNQNENGEGFWSVLVESDISHKSLVTVLAYLTHNGGKMTVGFAEKAAGILSASVYLRLIALPGSSAFKIYNPELFLQACRLLNKWNKSSCGKTSKQKQSAQTAKGRQKSGAGKRGKRQKRCSDFSLDITDCERSDEQEVDVEHSDSELQELDNLMAGLLQAVILICKTYSLRHSEYTAVQLMSILVGLTRINPGDVKEEMGQWDGRKCSLGALAYKAIYLLCQPFHGHVLVLTNEACKLLLNHLVMLEDGKQFQTLDHSVMLLRSQALKFIRYISKEFGERCTLCIKTLIQHMCFKVPDRSEYRSHTAQVVSELMECLPDTDYAKLLEWFKRLSKQKKVNQRSFVIEVTLVLLDKPERKLSADVSAELVEFASHKSMVCTILSRCSDSNASVRSRALVGFSSCINSKHPDVRSTIKDVITPVTTRGRPTAKHFIPTPKLVFTSAATSEDNTNDASYSAQAAVAPNPPSDDRQEGAGNLQEATKENCNAREPIQIVPTDKSFCCIELSPGFFPYLPDTEGVVSMFRRRALDTKVVVRKSALHALQNIIQFEAPLYQTQDLALLQERCADPALSVRKQAVQSLFELLQAFPADTQIQRAWVFGLLPQVMDRETSVQEKCFDLLEEMILQNLKPVGKTSDSSIEWELLNIIADENSEKLRRYFQKACQYWYRTKKLRPSMIEAVQSHVGSQNDQAAWMLLAEMAKTPVKIKHEAVLDHWKTVQTVVGDAACSKWSNVLAVLGTTSKSIPQKIVCDVLDDLKQRLHQFTYPPPLIAGMVNCVSKLHGCMELESSRRQMQAWGEELMADCDKYISSVVLNTQSEYVDEEELIRYMFTLGEVCQRCPTRMPKRAALLIQSIIASPCIGSIGSAGDSDAQQKADDRDGQSSHTDGFNGSQGRKEVSHDSQDGESQPDSHSSQSSQAVVSSQASQASQPLSQFRGSNMSSKLRAHAFITLGKLCLVDESLAKKTIAAMARELEESDSPAVRNNVVIIMGDLTIRYTTLVDRYVTNMAACLKDPSPLVRKNTLTILSRLLQEEYVKWKGVLFFRYITTILDEALEIKTLAEFCLEHLLLKKHPSMFFHPFLECIFHFNNYQTHAVYNKFKQTEGEKQKFSLAGKENMSRRMQLYSFMLEHMTDEQRFKTTDKINKEILAAVADRIIPLDTAGSQILHDALSILSCKEIKLSTLRSKGVEDTGEEAEDMAQIVTATAKKVLISQVVKRNVIENVVPVVISLKHMLEKSRSSLLKELMGYLRELLKDYKNEVKDILAADRQLAQEIEFDLRKFENQETEQPGSRQGNSTPVSFNAATPPVSRPSSRQPSRAGSPVTAPSPVLRDASAMMNIDVQNGKEAASRSSSPGAATPTTRRPSLAVSDAVKKAMSRVEQLKLTAGPLSPLRKDNRIGQSRQPTVQNQKDDDLHKSATPKRAGLETPEKISMSEARQSQAARAISTPANALYNITFGVDANVTMLPPSPIPSVRSNGQLCLSPTLQVRKKGSKTVIHMLHPEESNSKPVQWNVQSPVAKKAKSKTSSRDRKTPAGQPVTEATSDVRRSGRHRPT